MDLQRNQVRVRNDLLIALRQAPHLVAAADEFCKPFACVVLLMEFAWQALLGKLMDYKCFLGFWIVMQSTPQPISQSGAYL